MDSFICAGADGAGEDLANKWTEHNQSKLHMDVRAAIAGKNILVSNIQDIKESYTKPNIVQHLEWDERKVWSAIVNLVCVLFVNGRRQNIRA